MVNFDLRLYYFPAERLIKPRKRLAGIKVPPSIKKSIFFEEDDIEKLDEDSEVIALVEHFCLDLGFDNRKDLIEYITSNPFYKLIKDNQNRDAVIKVTTALKYIFSIKRIQQGLVMDDTIFTYHLPYLTEAGYDLECSLMLIREDYFKQSLQTLRNVIEVALTHGYYSLKDLDYEDVVGADDSRVPAFKEIIKYLRSENVLTPDLERRLFDLYKVLSGAVHSEVSKLNISKFHDYNSFLEWYDLYINIVQVYYQIVFQYIEVGI